MWFFMYVCYIFTALTFFMLFLTGLQGYLHFFVFNANHALFALLTIIVYLFTETLVIFYFVGIGVSIRDFVLANKLKNDYHKRSLAVKRKVYPPLLLNMLLVMILFISGGAVDTRCLPAWSHGLLFFISMIQFLDAVRIQHQSFKESTAIILEMSGLTGAVAGKV